LLVEDAELEVLGDPLGCFDDGRSEGGGRTSVAVSAKKVSQRSK
jgi:hypothetical protein